MRVDDDRQVRLRVGRDGVVEKRPWYEPSETLPHEPIISIGVKTGFDSLIVEESTGLKSAA